MYLIMLGAQGTGKGTVAGILSEKTGWPQISTGDIFRANISQNTDKWVYTNAPSHYASESRWRRIRPVMFLSLVSRSGKAHS